MGPALPTRSIRHQSGEHRQNEALRLSRARAGGDYHVAPERHRLLERKALVFIRLQVVAKRTARNKLSKLIGRLRAPGTIQRLVRHCAEIAAANGVRRDWLDKRLSPKISVAVEQLATLANQITVAKVERAIQVTQVEVAETSKEGNRIIHRSG